jgi:hypothetical protein
MQDRTVEMRVDKIRMVTQNLITKSHFLSYHAGCQVSALSWLFQIFKVLISENYFI